MTARVASTHLEVAAACLGCTWASTAANAHGNAARHHDATGHAVRVDVQRTTTYGDPSADSPGQENLMEQIADTAPGTVAA